MDNPRTHRARRAQRASWYHPVALARGLWGRPKLMLAIIAAALAAAVAPPTWSVASRAVLAWDIGALVYLAVAARVMATCSSIEIRARAEIEDETRFVFFTVILLAIATSLAAVVALITEAKAATGVAKVLDLALAGGAILVSWLVMQVVFTLHYAHDYYRPLAGTAGTAAGLTFPGDEHPDYWDFFYFTTSIGATSQTSDVAITTKSLRRLVTLQAVIAFAFNTSVIALAINLAASIV